MANDRMANADAASADGLAAKLVAARDAHAALLPDDLMRPKLEQLLVAVAPMLHRARSDRGPKLQPRDFGLREKNWIGADKLSLDSAKRASREVAFAALKQLLDSVWRKMDQKERNHKRRRLAHEVDGAHHTRRRQGLACLPPLEPPALVVRAQDRLTWVLLRLLLRPAPAIGWVQARWTSSSLPPATP